ncbi:MAG: hypothetical protein RLZZ127_2816, partial [Planctomycetota bacterium]
MPFRAVTILPLLACGIPTLSALDFYVSPGGRDSDPGTLQAPFRTLTRARDAVRAANTTMTADITVYLRGGYHRLGETLTMTQADSGMNGHRVVWCAYPGERPIISGGRGIAGWSLHDAGKGIWKASVPGLETRQLYVNHRRAVRAR